MQNLPFKEIIENVISDIPYQFGNLLLIKALMECCNIEIESSQSESSRYSLNVVPHRPLLSITCLKTRYEADLHVLVYLYLKFDESRRNLYS